MGMFRVNNPFLSVKELFDIGISLEGCIDRELHTLFSNTKSEHLITVQHRAGEDRARAVPRQSRCNSHLQTIMFYRSQHERFSFRRNCRAIFSFLATFSILSLGKKSGGALDFDLEGGYASSREARNGAKTAVSSSGYTVC